ncbi:flagellar motor switch phosphatase FliY [Alicyclobacillus contaminans]|uniref:flagellar motor switch phosphatase FliY n=1 Tax=Alicyclobacillus contaminans TaxID=392016 RepID=UPI000425D6F7|nr:flagellar motor switch phosphatase FliY [Alicyclobacillus contaminans]GMA49028.1 flagellar motor switch phosphatase FliY [Alicyclobacillus contaminans]
MTGDMKLSQDEIDALLGRTSESSSSESSMETETLTEAERDALGEVGNIGFGSAATSLSTLLNQRVEITTPTVSVMKPEDIPTDFPRPYVMVTVEYTEGLSGTNALAVEVSDAKTIADLMLGGDGRNTDVELNELHLSAVAEAMNQMMGGAATAMSQMFGMPINISPPTVQFVDMSNPTQQDLGFDSTIVNTAFRLKVGDLIDSHLMQLVPLHFAKQILGLLGSAGDSADSAPASTPADAAPQAVGAQTPVDAIPSQVPASPAAHGLEEAAAGLATAPAKPVRPVSVQSPEFVDFGDSASKAQSPRNLSLLFDVNLNVTVELGRTKKTIREILELTPGSIVELDKLAGEPVDILVNNKRIAIGEVVVIDENFGVRVTDILHPADRVKQLQ